MPSRTILYLVTEDWAFLQFRLPMARAARAAGFSVVVASRIEAHRAQIEAEGFRAVPLSWRRRSFNPLAALAAVLEIAGVYRRERPDIVHHVAMKPVLLGGLAAWLAGVPAVVNALTGLGTLFIGSGGIKASLIGPFARAVLRFVLHRRNSRLLVQNRDDRDLLIRRLALDPERVRLIRGSGVDTRHFDALPDPPSPPVTLAYVGRFLDDKGVRELVAAYRTLRERGLDLRLILAGTPDPENPTSIPDAEIAEWQALDGVELTGHVSDVRPVWARAHIAVLMSRREGLPKSLLEAASSRRALITSDVPGCREIVEHDRNGLLVPLDDPAALIDAIERLAGDDALRRKFAAASRDLVLSDMAADAVGRATVALYHELLG